jgi:ankyrin repeat protein
MSIGCAPLSWPMPRWPRPAHRRAIRRCFNAWFEAKDASRQLEMAGVLIAARADVHGPLYACSSCDNVPAARLLLDGGAAVNGSGGWSPIEEAMYWNSQGVICLLLERGASIHNLRIAAGLGRTDVVETFFAADGFDYAGTGLHYAALNGHRATVALLIDRGADARITDTKVSQTAAGWADHGGEPEIRDLLLTRS